jgi:hypothetical protein
MSAQIQLGQRVSHVTLARYVAIAASLVAAALYVLIGFQVVSIGQAASGGTPDLLGFGLAAGAFFGALAVLMAFTQGRLIWIPIGLADVAVIVAYFAMANLREPQFEMWGLLVKAAQVVMLGALVYLVYTGRTGDHRR